jgi:hypothetical protein
MVNSVSQQNSIVEWRKVAQRRELVAYVYDQGLKMIAEANSQVLGIYGVLGRGGKKSKGLLNFELNGAHGN